MAAFRQIDWRDTLLYYGLPFASGLVLFNSLAAGLGFVNLAMWLRYAGVIKT